MRSVILKRIYQVTVGGIIISLLAAAYFWNIKNRRDIVPQKASKVYFVDNISQSHQQLIDRFNQEYAGKIEVVPVDLPFTKFSTNERKELLARALRSKSDQIDVFAVDIIWVPRFARWSEILGNYFSTNEREQMLDSALASCYYEGQFVAVPFYIDIGMMYYRQDILQQYPQADQLEEKLRASISWSELIELKKYFPDQPIYLFAAKNFEGLVCSFIENILAQKPDIFKRQPIQLNVPEVRNALQLLVDLVHKYKITAPEIIHFDEMQTYEFALNHDALCFRGWPGLQRHFQDQFDPQKLANIQQAAVPHWEGYSPASVYGGWNLMISKFSTRKHEALEFVRFVLRPENQKMMFEQSGFIPVDESVYADSAFMQANPDLSYYRKLMDHGVHRPFLVNYTKISDVLSYYVNLAIKGDISVEEALERASKEIESKTRH